MVILYSAFGILIGITVHEFAHAFVADKLGDKTPRFQGRLTLNPIAHIDPVGLIMMLIVGIGWGKPVQVNTRAFKNPYKDDLLVSLAGPVSNLVTAFILAFLYALVCLFLPIGSSVGIIVKYIFIYAVIMNCMLFILNLIPLPGFDGFHVIRDLFPKVFYRFSDMVYRYQMLIFIVFILLLGDYVVGIPSNNMAYIFTSFWLKILHVI